MLYGHDSLSLSLSLSPPPSLFASFFLSLSLSLSTSLSLSLDTHRNTAVMVAIRVPSTLVVSYPLNLCGHALLNLQSTVHTSIVYRAPECYPVNCLCREKKIIKLLPHRSDHSTTTTTDTSDHSNMTDHSDATPGTANQHTSTVQPLGQDRTIEEATGALTISEDENMCIRNTDAQSKETVSQSLDSVAPTSSKYSTQ